MLKLLMIVALSSVVLFGNDSDNEAVDAQVIAFVEKSVQGNETYTFDKATIVKKEDLPDVKPWRAYLIRVDVTLLKPETKKISMNDVIFTDGKVLSKDFIDLNTAQSIKNRLFQSH